MSLQVLPHRYIVESHYNKHFGTKKFLTAISEKVVLFQRQKCTELYMYTRSSGLSPYYKNFLLCPYFGMLRIMLLTPIYSVHIRKFFVLAQNDILEVLYELHLN